MNVELGSPQRSQAPAGPGISDYVNVVKRRAWQVILPFILCGLGGLGVAFLVPRQYEALTSVIIEDPDTMVGNVFGSVGYAVPHKHLLATVRTDVMSTEFLSPLIDQYRINEGFNVAIPKERAKLFDRMRKKLLVNAALVKTGGTDFIEFLYIGRDAVKVTDFVNAVRRKWQEEFVRRYSDAVKAVETNIRTVYDESLARVTEAQTKLKNFQEANGTLYFGKDPGGTATRLLLQLQADLVNYETQLQGDEASLRTTQGQLEKVPAVSQIDSSRKRNPDWTAQSQKVDLLSSEIALAREMGYKDSWPALAGKIKHHADEQKKLEAIEQFVTDSVQQGATPQYVTLQAEKTKLESSIASLRDKVTQTRKRVADLERDSKSIPEKVAQAAAFQDAVYSAQAQFERAERTRDTARATRERVMSKVKTFFRTVEEKTPEEARFQDSVYPNFLLFAGIGAFIGLLIGGGVAFVSEFAAASFTTANQVRYSLQVPVIGEVSPLVAAHEVRARKRRRAQIIVGLVVLLLVVVGIHAMWFDQKMRSNLPPFLRDIMRRAYGVGGPK